MFLSSFNYPNIKIFEKFYLIIRDIAIQSELSMEFGKKTVFILCVNLFIMLLFFEIKKYNFVRRTKLFLC